MSNRKSVLSLVCAIVVGAPLAATADGTWVRTNDEAGSQFVPAKVGATSRTAPPTDTKPLVFGTISVDRQFVFIGEEGGWQLRPMQYRLEGGRFVHVDDPDGHMNRTADTRPLTPEQRTALKNSGGS